MPQTESTRAHLMEPFVRILIVEDTRMTRRMLERYLQALGYEVLQASSGEQALQLHRQHRVPFVITDWEMPGMSGLELVRRIRESQDGTYTYVVFLTAREGKADLVTGIGAGADDYLRKPFDKDELAVRVRAGQRIVELQERLERVAETDALTGLWNRRGLERWFADPQGGPQLAEEAFAFVIGDIDHFKRVNDERGHAAGDEVLRLIADSLAAGFPPGARVVRVGGEEFLAVFPAASATLAMAATEAVRATVEARPLEVGHGEPLRLTCSFGVFVATPGSGIPDLQDAQFQADRALYRSKAEGRNRVTLAD